MEKHKSSFVQIFRRNRIRFLGLAGMAAASALIIYLSFLSYVDYQTELAETEQKQLLTMAKTIGQSLVNYIEQELDSMDLYFSSPQLHTDETDTDPQYHHSDESQPDLQNISAAVRYFLTQNNDLYDAVACYDDRGRLFCRYGDIPFEPQPASAADEQAVICGKQLCSDGWYRLFISRRITLDGQNYTVVYAMNLNRIHTQIVAPVQIGNGGYSVVKDSDLSIIMHHAQDQIGMDAVYDRSRRYPELDLTDLFAWITRQNQNVKAMALFVPTSGMIPI